MILCMVALHKFYQLNGLLSERFGITDMRAGANWKMSCNLSTGICIRMVPRIFVSTIFLNYCNASFVIVSHGKWSWIKFLRTRFSQMRYAKHWIICIVAQALQVFEHARNAYMACIRSSTHLYQQHICDRLSKLDTRDRRWWSLTRELLYDKPKLSSIPALRDTSGEWIHDPVRKANLFKDTWQRKFILPDEHPDVFFFAEPFAIIPLHLIFVCRSRACKKIFAWLKEHLSLIHIWRCRRYSLCRSRWSPYH